MSKPVSIVGTQVDGGADDPTVDALGFNAGSGRQQWRTGNGSLFPTADTPVIDKSVAYVGCGDSTGFTAPTFRVFVLATGAPLFSGTFNPTPLRPRNLLFSHTLESELTIGFYSIDQGAAGTAPVYIGQVTKGIAPSAAGVAADGGTLFACNTYTFPKRPCVIGNTIFLPLSTTAPYTQGVSPNRLRGFDLTTGIATACNTDLLPLIGAETPWSMFQTAAGEIALWTFGAGFQKFYIFDTNGTHLRTVNWVDFDLDSFDCLVDADGNAWLLTNSESPQYVGAFDVETGTFNFSTALTLVQQPSIFEDIDIEQFSFVGGLLPLCSCPGGVAPPTIGGIGAIGTTGGSSSTGGGTDNGGGGGDGEGDSMAIQTRFTTHGSIAVGTNAVSSLSVESDVAIGLVLLTVEGTIRYFLDGSDPDSTHGHLVTDGQTIQIAGRFNLEGFRAIAIGSAATVTVSYSRP